MTRLRSPIHMSVAAVIVVMAGPLEARDGETSTAIVPPTELAPDWSSAPSNAPLPAIRLEKRVGSVTLARAGDSLGERRFAATSSGDSGVTVSFVARPATQPRAYAGPGKMPTGSPLQSARLASSFGWRPHPITGQRQLHAGVDLAAPMGSPVHATEDGRVRTAGWMGNYGVAIRLDHGGDIETRYAHLSAVAVIVGQDVKRGDVIGYVGSTGQSTGAHLHYEIRTSQGAINPLKH